MRPQIIAYYLPQFHPIPENDKWWGKGFTEWTNVGKAKPLWKGHDQPRVPTDLGYYDLRLPAVREQQAELAREAGVTAFCYWHYWFGNGKRLLERVFDEVLESGKPDFPFCLGWANHSWYAKSWNKDSCKDKLLIEQIYPGQDDARLHLSYLLKAFRDKRYVKIGGKPFFLIYDGTKVPPFYIDIIREGAKANGFPDIFLVTSTTDIFRDKEDFLRKGFDAVTYIRQSTMWMEDYLKMNLFQKYSSRVIRIVKQFVTGIPRGARDYTKVYKRLVTPLEYNESVIPQIVPQWDHSPRSGDKANVIFYNSDPMYFYENVKDALNAIRGKSKEKQIIILKSWNEWGEGNYMEPDLSHGKGYIYALRQAIDEFGYEMNNE